MRPSKSRPKKPPVTSRRSPPRRTLQVSSDVTSRTTDTSSNAGADARTLLSAAAVRRTAHRVLGLAESELLADWELDLAQLAPAADLVMRTIRERYPTLDIPFHARWRHFVFGRRNLWLE